MPNGHVKNGQGLLKTIGQFLNYKIGPGEGGNPETAH